MPTTRWSTSCLMWRSGELLHNRTKDRRKVANDEAVVLHAKVTRRHEGALLMDPDVVEDEVTHDDELEELVANDSVADELQAPHDDELVS